MPKLDSKPDQVRTPSKHHPFRRAVLRGLAVVLPPLLTIVILLWVWNTVQDYVLVPVENLARYGITRSIADIHEKQPAGATAAGSSISSQVGQPTVKVDGQLYVEVANNQWIPLEVYTSVAANPGSDMPTTADGIYRRYVDIEWLTRWTVVPAFLSVFILSLYTLGKFLAAGIGRISINLVEQLIHRLPIIRNVYGSVKQVTDFVFSEQEIAYTRVVAVEYPRCGIWSLGFVTGESMLDIRSAANEPVLSVLIPTSPMPATGYTVTVRKIETIDLNISVDQALQFIVSCGVVVPTMQQYTKVGDQITAAVSQRLTSETDTDDLPDASVESNVDTATNSGDTVDPSSNGSSRSDEPSKRGQQSLRD